jgi:glycosyltransferase involved in cell wall biosynthesis
MSATVAVCFTNFGPYHLARLRALARALSDRGVRLVAIEVSGSQAIYPWQINRASEPFEWMTLFPDRVLEEVPRAQCFDATRRALDRLQPDVLGIVGYYRPESMAMLRWARSHDRPTVLMSESQAIDHPRVWWKEAIKRRRVRLFDAALVGGPSHRDYLVSLGMTPDRIALGYNAVDGDQFAAEARAFRDSPSGRVGLPARPFFLAVNRFVAEKNLPRLIRAFARYRSESGLAEPWDLVLCGDGPSASEVADAIDSSQLPGSIHRPGFLQAGELARWYAFASAFVHPSLSEPWGLVVNEAAACGLPLLVSNRAGCVETFVTEGKHSTGFRIDGRDVEAMAEALHRIANLPEMERAAMGRRAAEVAAAWGPDRFASGALEAIAFASEGRTRPKRKLVESISGSSPEDVIR